MYNSEMFSSGLLYLCQGDNLLIGSKFVYGNCAILVVSVKMCSKRQVWDMIWYYDRLENSNDIFLLFFVVRKK